MISSNLFSKEKVIDLIQLKKPYYSWASSLEIGYYSPINYYKSLLNSGPYFNFKLKFNPKIIDHLITQFELGYIPSSFKNDSDIKYQIFPVGVGLNYQIPLWKELYTSLNGTFGRYFFNISTEKHTFDDFYLKGGAGLFYGLTSNLEVGVNASYLYLFDPQNAIEGFNLTASFSYIFGTVLNEKDIEISSISIKNIFSALYTHYYKKQVGMVRLKNTTHMQLKNVQVSVYIKNYMDEKSISPVKHSIIKKNRTAITPLYFYFNDKIKTLHNDTQTTGIIEISYTKPDGKKYIKRDIIKVKIYNKNALIWDDLTKIGSFITYEDKNIIQFARSILTNSQQTQLSISGKLLQIIKIYQALQHLPIHYVNDPKTPYKSYSMQEMLTDYVQYPIETINNKTGDCDDLSILTASLLESIGIRTALVTTPGHIFILIEADDFINTEKTIKFQDKRWIPLEVTLLQKGITESWIKGLQQYRDAKQKTIKTTHEITTIFPPLSLKNKKPLPLKLNKNFSLYLSKEIVKLKKYLHLDVKNSSQQLSPSQLNDKGIEFAKQNNLLEAKKYFLQAIKKNKKYKTAYYNLIHLYTITKNYQLALNLYQKFSQFYNNDERIEKLIEKVKLEIK